jgi:hypothetical protein
MKLAAELTSGLREFAASGAELRERRAAGAIVAAVWEVRGADDKPLLHIWSEECNLTRRVIAITDHSGARLVLAVERFGRARPGRLEFVRSDFERPERELLREEFCERLAQILGRQSPMRRSSRSPRRRTWSIRFRTITRGVLERGSSHTAFLAVADGETQDTINIFQELKFSRRRR